MIPEPLRVLSSNKKQSFQRFFETTLWIRFRTLLTNDKILPLELYFGFIDTILINLIKYYPSKLLTCQMLHKLSDFTVLQVLSYLFKKIGIHSTQSLTRTKRQSQKKRKAKIKSIPKSNICLLILDFKRFITYVKGTHSAGREFKSLAVQGKKLLG